MIASVIGRTFLNAYNEEHGTSYDAKTFFKEQYYPLFFDHNKYMMTAGNSPLENPKLSWDAMLNGKKEYETAAQRHERFIKFMDKIEDGEADASIAVGFPTLDATSTTSGQVTDMKMPLDEEDIFLSWIGSGLGVGVLGGFSILFNHKDILMDVYQGWKYYREALENTPKLRGNQINTWNGQWLVYYNDHRIFNQNNPLAGFNPYSGKNGVLGIDLQTWTKVLVGIAKKYRDIQLMGYVYNIGQTNTTLGFIPFNLMQIRRPVQLYEKFFGINDGHKAENLWGTAIGFKSACRVGAIGLRAMEPKGLAEYMQKGKLPKPEKDEEQRISYNTYKIWILSMLNNEELWRESEELAELLADASVNKDKKISTKSKHSVEEVLAAVNKKQFVDAVTNMMSSIGSTEKLVSIVKDVHSMPTDNVPYFLTLVRFQYAAVSNKSNL